MKKILFLLLLTVSVYGQNPSRFAKIQITGNSNSATATKVNVQETNGEVNTQAINTGFNKNIGLGSTDVVGATTLLNQYSSIPSDWSAQSYVLNSVVFYGGKQWIAKMATVTGDVPAVSPKWEEITFEALANKTVTVDQTIIDGSTNAVSGNAVFDGLALKANSSDTFFKHTSTVGEPQMRFNGNGINVLSLKNTSDSGDAYSTLAFSEIGSDTNLKEKGAVGVGKTNTAVYPWRSVYLESFANNDDDLLPIRLVQTTTQSGIGYRNWRRIDIAASGNSLGDISFFSGTGAHYPNETAIFKMFNNGNAYIQNYLGLGTDIPTAKLTINGFNDGAAIDIKNTASNKKFRIVAGNVGGNLQFENDLGAEVARITQSGNTLFGTTTDNGVDKVQVNGTISASPATASNHVVVKSQLDAFVPSGTVNLTGDQSITGTKTFTNTSTTSRITMNTQSGATLPSLFLNNQSGATVPSFLLSASTAGVGGKVTVTSGTGIGMLFESNQTGSGGASATMLAFDNVLANNDITPIRIKKQGVEVMSVDYLGNITANKLIIPNAVNANEAVNKGQLDAVGRPYKAYTATLIQNGTNAPVATVFENTLGGTVVWNRTATGSYTATLAGVFTNGKVFFQISNDNSFPTTTRSIYMFNSGVNDCQLRTYSGSTLTDNLMNNTSIEIRVYN